MNTLNITNILFKPPTFNKKGWVWSPEKLRLIREVEWVCPISINGTWVAKDGYLQISDNTWTFKNGYQWNGATGVPSGQPDTTVDLPVISLTDKPVPKLWFATLIHDAGCSATDDPTFPFKRYMVDIFFYGESKVANFEWSLLYYYGVRIFGTPLNYLTRMWYRIKKSF